MTEDERELVALLRLLEYLRGEVQRLGWKSAVPLLDLTMSALFREIARCNGGRFLFQGDGQAETNLLIQ